MLAGSLCCGHCSQEPLRGGGEGTPQSRWGPGCVNAASETRLTPTKKISMPSKCPFQENEMTHSMFLSTVNNLQSWWRPFILWGTHTLGHLSQIPQRSFRLCDSMF